MKHKGPQIHIDSCISDSPVFEHVQVRRYEAKTFGLQKLNLESSWNIFITQACSIELWKTRNVWSTLSTSSSLPVSSGGQPGASALSVRIRGGGVSHLEPRGGKINPNIDSIDTTAGIGIRSILGSILFIKTAFWFFLFFGKEK